MDKSPDAFRTISEVADDLDLPQHVLRFWETRFSHIKPLKRGGGRRYYRPDDVLLLRGIKHLLYGEGYTIKGVQRILKEQGLRYVMAIWREDVPEASTGEKPPGHEAYAPKPERGGSDRFEPLFDADAEPVSFAPARAHLPVARVAELAARRPNFEPILDSMGEDKEPDEPLQTNGGQPPEPVKPAPRPRPAFSESGRNRLEAALRELTELRHVLDGGI